MVIGNVVDTVGFSYHVISKSWPLPVAFPDSRRVSIAWIRVYDVSLGKHMLRERRIVWRRRLRQRASSRQSCSGRPAVHVALAETVVSSGLYLGVIFIGL